MEKTEVTELIKEQLKDNKPSSDHDLRYGSALFVALFGLAIAAGLAYLLSCNPGWKPNDVSTLVSAFIGIVGTLVGAFLGVQVGAAGKQKSEESRQKSEDKANRALAALPPEKAAEVLSKS
jgi:uncharacterized membrane protein